MKLYEIDKAIEQCITEDGEVLDEEMLVALEMERATKVENVAVWAKNLASDIAAIKAEEQALAERRKKLEARRESLLNWLSGALNGEPMSTARVEVKFRRSEVVEIEDASLIPTSNEFCKYTPASWTPDKVAIKKAIKSGVVVEGAKIVEKRNISVK